MSKNKVGEPATREIKRESLAVHRQSRPSRPSPHSRTRSWAGRTSAALVALVAVVQALMMVVVPGAHAQQPPPLK